MTPILSTRISAHLMEQMRKAAEAEHCSLREIIERSRKSSHTSLIREKIIDSYAQLDDADIALAEEQMADYFSQITHDL